MLRPRNTVLPTGQSVRLGPAVRLAKSTALETLELHVLRQGDSPPVDIVLSRTQPRTGHGRPYLDVGLLVADRNDLVARSAREENGTALPLPTDGPWRARFADLDLALDVTTLAHRAGISLHRVTGRIDALEQKIVLEDRLMFSYERRKARRPYAWARAMLVGELDGAPIVCVVETGRRRAGSVVLPELGRVLLFGPGTQGLSRNLVVTPLPVRAQYGTGRLQATALAPGHRVVVELASPPDETALFEMVDPDGEAAYAHRAGDATAELLVTKRRVEVVRVKLTGRFEWGARAGDPRVAHRAWRA